MGIDGSIGAISADFTVLLVGLLPCAGGVIVKEKKERENTREKEPAYSKCILLFFYCFLALFFSLIPSSPFPRII